MVAFNAHMAYPKDRSGTFAERCRFAIDKCWQENPPLMLAGPFHMSACWRWQDIRDGKISLSAVSS
jgi:hypothetical protein